MQPYQQYPNSSSSRSAFRLNPAIQHEDNSSNAKAGPSTTAVVSAPTAGPRVATGDWTRDLVHLAKTAELKKHALGLQLHTAHILSAHATLDQKSKAIQDVKEQQNKLESERLRLLNCLREINEDRGKMDILESNIERECSELRSKITEITEGDYTTVKREVDRLRQELGQPPLPSLQSTIEEKKFAYLNERRLNENDKRPAADVPSSEGQPPPKKARGRPKGSKNSNKKATASGSTSAGPVPGRGGGAGTATQTAGS